MDESVYTNVGKLYCDLVKASETIQQQQIQLSNLQSKAVELESKLKIFEERKIKQAEGS